MQGNFIYIALHTHGRLKVLHIETLAYNKSCKKKWRLLYLFNDSILFCLLFPSVSGTYKPRIRCYDTYHLSLKFERCLDSEGKLMSSAERL